MARSTNTHRRPNAMRRFYTWMTGRHSTSLVVLLALSIGLAMVGVQIDQLWLLIVFAVIWGITFLALVAQIWGRWAAGHRHAAPA
ncbi:hypothetical protein GCM10010441_19270 [Kitasatospora paracochleata]|uniref:Uncharacterized protein n=1 Tax=Kitasatospora paracochleata TaxID=58354 RepID=A0ABT1J3D3_9ACTN|nr:hypothetical protein [Kitasatospora paracochleata]MCP2311937.1 hypothetical protein [Kitasatospora paracochleata]